MGAILSFLGSKLVGQIAGPLAAVLGVACLWLWIANTGLKSDLADEVQAFADYKLAQVEALNQAVVAAVEAAEAAAELEKQAALDAVEREVEIVTQIQTVVREVEVFIPRSVDTFVPNGFMLVHDLSASGSSTTQPSTSASGFNAAASEFTMSQAAVRVATNYGICRSNAAQLEGLIQWTQDVETWWTEVEANWPTGEDVD